MGEPQADAFNIPVHLDRREAKPPGENAMFKPLSAEELTSAPANDTDKSSKVPICPVPDDAPPMRFRHPKHGEPTTSWAYHDGDGQLVGYVCRWDFQNEDGERAKDFFPVTFCDLGDGIQAWRANGFPTPRPLFGLPGILARPDAWVLVTEGEKARDAAAELFPDLVCTTPPHGSKSPHLADWTPLVGRKVLIWPDNDDAGRAYAEAVTQLAHDAGATSVQTVIVPEDWLDGWDLADAVPEGADLRSALDAAKSYQQFSESKFPPGFAMAETGLFWRDISDSEKPDLQIASPFEVVAETRDKDGNAWGVLVRWQDHDGGQHEWAMPRAMLAGDGTEARRALMDGGLYIAPQRKARELLTAFLASVRVTMRAQAVSRIGWHGRAFVLPDDTIGDTAGETVLLQSTGGFDHAFRSCGTLADWQHHIARYAAGNSRLAFALSAAFAAPLLYLADAESGGVHFRGASSTGKTTALAVAGSAWGGGGVKGYIRQWRATDNGLESVARAHSDALLCLDELSQIDSKVAGAAAYMLANGSGKARAGRDGAGRPAAEWRCLFISSGEIALADKLAEDGRGRKATAGQAVRVLDISADAGAGMGLFENLHGFESADAFARHLKQASSESYGVAAREFLSKITDKFEDTQDSVRGFKDEFVSNYCPPGADGQVRRAADRFGLIAASGEFATVLGILPWERGAAVDAAAACFRAWLVERGGVEAAEVTSGISQIRRFIELHGESRFTPWDSDRVTINRAGFRKLDGDDGAEYFVLPEVWNTELCSGLDSGAVARMLAARGMLKASKGRLQSSVRLPGFGKPVRCYVLTNALFDGDMDG